MRIFEHFLGPMFATLLGGLLIWALTQESFDVRYTLSEKIPLSFGGVAAEAVQLLEVKNLSDKEIEKITITLPPRVIEHAFKLYSQKDKPEIIKSKEGVEIFYPTLPPKGAFQVIIKSSVDGIEKSQINIRHSKGDVDDALKKNSTYDKIAIVAFFFPISLYFFLSFVEFKSFSYRSMADYEPKEILRMIKPFYLSKNNWSIIRGKSYKNFSSSEYIYGLPISEIIESKNYRILNDEKPNFLTSDEWEKFQKDQSEEMIQAINKKLATAYFSLENKDEFFRLLRIAKPKYFPSDKWDEWRKKIQKVFFEMISCRSFDFFEFMRDFNIPKPECVDSEIWEGFKKKQNKKYFFFLRELIIECPSYQNPIDLLKQKNTSILENGEAEKLNEMAYRTMMISQSFIDDEFVAKQFLDIGKPEWIKDVDYKKRKELAENILEVKLNQDKCKKIFFAFGKIFNGEIVNDGDVRDFDIDLQRKIKEIDLHVREAKRENTSERARVEQESTRLENEKNKITSQLKILHEIFVDPTSMDRIEYYNNPFSSGNFNVLKRIAGKLQQEQNNAS